MTLKKIGILIIAGLILTIVVYREGNSFEIQRLIVSLIGIIEGIIFVLVFKNLDKTAVDKKWSSSKRLGRTTILSIGLLIILLLTDKLISHVLELYSKDYEITWTIFIPGSIIIAQLFKSLDLWAYENEKNDKLRGT